MRFAIFGAALAMFAATAHAAEAHPKKAPDWTLADVDGHKVSLADFHGRVVLLSFWAPAYPPCVAEIPANTKLQAKYGPQGLSIVAVYVDTQGAAVVKAFMEAHDIKYTVVMGDEGIKEAYGALDGYPTTFLIDRQGMIRFTKLGRRPPTFEKDLAELLGAPAPTPGAGLAITP